ncbi:MAG: hypothetical protein PHE65_00670 [Candidatus Omnitrophica bacterium]|nr:hypothetical protein [Candidatus Omnitrophota bacterium]
MIPFADLKGRIKAAGYETLRTESDTYFEVVFLKAKLEDHTTALNELFGKIAWPSDTPVSAEIKKAIAQYGSVMAGQTLYAEQDGGNVVFAMLWPWGDREHITLKAGETK